MPQLLPQLRALQLIVEIALANWTTSASISARVVVGSATDAGSVSADDGGALDPASVRTSMTRRRRLRSKIEDSRIAAIT